MFKKVLNFLNIHPDKNQTWLLISIFLVGLLWSYSSPTMTKEIISSLPAQWLAIESMTVAVSSLIIGMLWQGKIREKAIKNFAILAIAESSLTFLLGMYLIFIHYNVWILAIGSLIYTNLISLFVGKCMMAFKSVLWVEREREIFDNNQSIVTGIVCVLGGVIAIIALPPLKVSLFLWAITCVIDDLGWIIVYNRNKERLKQIE